MLGAQVDDLTLPGHALTVEDVELGLLEGRRHLVLDHLDLGLVADDLLALLDGADTADVEAHRGVELEGVTPGGGLRAAEHDADLHADLIDEDHQAVGALDVAGELAQGLGHQARLKADVGVAHLALDLGLGGQGRHRVHHYHVHRPGAHQHVGDLQGLLAGVRLGDQQFVHVDAQAFGVDRVQGVLGIDEGAGTALLLGLGDDVQGEGSLARGLGPVDFHHPALGHATHAEGDIQAQGTGGDDFHIAHHAGIAHAHDRALAKLLLDLAQGGGQGLLAVFVHCYSCLGFALAGLSGTGPGKFEGDEVSHSS